MKKTKIISIIFGILIIISCKQNVEKKAELKTEKLTELEAESKLDTLNADNYNVLFFHPTESEFNELLKENGEDSGLYEVDSDFGFYASKVYDSITKTDLKVKNVTERIIKYSTDKGIKYTKKSDRLEKALFRYKKLELQKHQEFNLRERTLFQEWIMENSERISQIMSLYQ